MMQFIRSRAGKFVVIPIILAFIGWMVFEIGRDVTGAGGGRPGEVGTVNGTPISQDAYANAIQSLTDQARQNGQEISAEVQQQIEEQAWNQLVAGILIRQELGRRGIRVTDQEVVWAARNVPHPNLSQQEIFLTNGQFDINKYREFLSGSTVTQEMYLGLEAFYRDWLPREKLARQLAAGRYVSDAELWRAYRDETETATVDYVSLDLARLAPRSPAVTDAEVRRYYDEHRDEFERGRGARLNVAIIPLTTTEADRQATVQRAREIRAQIAGGADFAELAREHSADPSSAVNGGELGTFRRGQMVPAFDSAAFSLPLNQVSEPVVTEYGAHLVQVTARTEDQATARHILLPFEKTEEEQARLDAKLDSLQSLAETRGLQTAARLTGASYRPGIQITDEAPFIPGAGSAMEALNWAQDEWLDPAREPKVKPVSDSFENEQALYVVELESYHGRGRTSLAEARGQIQAQLALEKRRATARAEGEKLLAAIRGGQTLEQAAAARGLTVTRTPPFTRVRPNQELGQANAAVGAAFGTPIGRVSQVVETAAGLFLVRPVQRTDAVRAEFDKQKESLRARVDQQLRQGVFDAWLDAVRESAKIRDNRERLRQRQQQGLT
ncbi:MAG TPA: peptidylprolyl isomerase [Longimicrobium sp.]|nr:peptidylprolyl isomerase [Longimicrobium sp.]